MMKQPRHDHGRHLLAALVGIPLTIGIFILIPLLSTVSYQMPRTAPMMVVDLIELPKRKTMANKTPAPKSPVKPVQPKKKRPPRPKVKTPPPKKEIPKHTDHPALKASVKQPPEEIVEKQVQTEKPIAPRVSEAAANPVPTPIFKLSAMPRFLHREMPVFPEKMKKLGRSATVKLKALIDKEGKVRNVIVEKSAGPEFDKAAVTALKKSSFFPGMMDGKPVAVMLRLPVRFRLL